MSAPHLLVILVLAFSVPATAQGTQSQAAEDEVRGVLLDYMRAVRTGGPAQLEFLSNDARFFSSGGASLDRAFLTAGSRPAAKTRSNLIRHIHFPRPGVALAIVIWRDASAKPPFDAGMADYTLVREDGKWKIAVARQGYLPSPDSVRMPAETTVPGDGSLSAEERAGGWESLFDGKTSNGWIAMSGSKELPGAWRIDDGSLVTVAGERPMALRTQRKFESFELAFEWKMSVGGNSGVKYRLFAVALSPDGSYGDAEGYEYQLADDDGDAGARVDRKQLSGSLYGVTPVNKSAARPVGEWNQSRVLVATDHVEHWLNGVQTARYELDVAVASPIALQHHSSEVRFRNLRIRRDDVAGGQR